MATLSPAQIAAYARQAGFTPAQAVIMTAIALGESGGNPLAYNDKNSNGSVDHGVWQINSVHRDILAIGDWRDPAINARMAKMVFDKQGYQAWAVYNSRTYAGHLAAAQKGAGQPVTLPTTPTGNPVTGGVNLLTNPRTYVRVAMFIAGITLVMIALAMMGWDSVPDSVKSTAVKAAKIAVTKKV